MPIWYNIFEWIKRIEFLWVVRFYGLYFNSMASRKVLTFECKTLILIKPDMEGGNFSCF